jgi:uncharacterized lipoprotein YmbA
MTVAVTRAVFIVAALAGLAIPSACLRTPAVHYYTLVNKGPAGPPRAGVRYTVYVAPASVPETVDRPELVLRVSATEVAVDDDYRWAEPLRTGIARAVADGLARRLEGALVSTSEEGPKSQSDVEITIDVQHLDVALAEGAAIEVVWTARWADGRSTRTGRSFARARGAPGGSHDAAVAACAATLESVSDAIARSVRSEYVSRR